MNKKKRSPSDYNRKFTRCNKNLAQRKRFLIVCEDSKSSVGYFRSLLHDYRISEIVSIYGDGGSAPSSVLKYAEEQIIKNHKNQYDAIYCVFDKDDHQDYDTTLNKIKNQQDNIIQAITCIPCFELWILLHFEDSTKYITSKDLSAKIKKYIPKFRKEDYGALYKKELINKTEIAVDNSVRILKQAEKEGRCNPSTKMHILIKDLQKARN